MKSTTKGLVWTGWIRIRGATCSKPSSPRTQTSQFRKWLRVARRSLASAGRGWIFLGKRCWRSWMIRMIRFLIWLKRHKQLDRRQMSALRPRSLTQVKLLAIYRSLRTSINIASNYLHKSIRVIINDSIFQRIFPYPNLKQMLQALMQMAIRGVRKGLPSHQM